METILSGELCFCWIIKMSLIKSHQLSVQSVRERKTENKTMKKVRFMSWLFYPRRVWLSFFFSVRYACPSFLFYLPSRSSSAPCETSTCLTSFPCLPPHCCYPHHARQAYYQTTTVMMMESPAERKHHKINLCLS